MKTKSIWQETKSSEPDYSGEIIKVFRKQVDTNMTQIEAKIDKLKSMYSKVTDERRIKNWMNLESLEPGLKIDLRETVDSTDSSDNDNPVETDKWWHNYKHIKEIKHYSW